MKKVFIIASILVASLLAFSSCDETNYTPEYDITLTGDADGDVEVTFPNGSFMIAGTAKTDFHYGNINADDVSATLFASSDELSPELQEFKEETDSLITVTSATGTYYLHGKVYAKEPVTGVVISWDREFTNR